MHVAPPPQHPRSKTACKNWAVAAIRGRMASVPALCWELGAGRGAGGQDRPPPCGHRRRARTMTVFMSIARFSPTVEMVTVKNCGVAVMVPSMLLIVWRMAPTTTGDSWIRNSSRTAAGSASRTYCSMRWRRRSAPCAAGARAAGRRCCGGGRGRGGRSGGAARATRGIGAGHGAPAAPQQLQRADI
jgi:hypothetical protein